MNVKFPLIAALLGVVAVSACSTREYPSPVIPADWQEVKDQRPAEVRKRALASEFKGYQKFTREYRKVVYFDTAKSDLSIEDKEMLNDFTERLSEYNDYEIIVRSHADVRGTEESNADLSQMRAQSVVQHLLDRSVPSAKITMKALGERKPAILGKSDYVHEKNRRVEILLKLSRKGYSAK